MEDEAIFSVISKCFAPVDEGEWSALTKGDLWPSFLNGARRAMQEEDSFGCTASAMSRAKRRCPLQDFLSAGEVRALFAPPAYAEKQRFAARHFTGGLPESAMPVESLYVPWSSIPSQETPFSRSTGLYCGDSARYMKELIEGMGMEVPAGFAPYPDHLALELDMVAVLLRSGMRDEARRFLAERFSWLTGFRLRLLGIKDEASFYIGLVDVVMGITAQQGRGAVA